MNLIYDKYGRPEPGHVYLAKPGKRLLGELNSIDDETGSLERNLNNTYVLSFDVYKYVNGELANFYDLISRHYELYLTGVGWFKINENPDIHNDGYNEYLSIRAESLEIELQQYDLVGFRINCGTVDSAEMMATDNVYEDEDGYNIFRENVKFYRDTSELEDFINEFGDGDINKFKEIFVNNTAPLSSWRIEIDEDSFNNAVNSAIQDEQNGDNNQILIHNLQQELTYKHTQDQLRNSVIVFKQLRKYVDLKIDKSPYEDTDVELSLKEVLQAELSRQKELSFLWLALHEHGWSVGYVDDKISADNPKKLSDMVGKFEVDSQDIYSFLTQDVASYFKCVFVFDTENYEVNAYRVENIGSDTNVFLAFENVQSDMTCTSDDQIYTVYHVSNSDTIDVRQVNFGDDSIEDISYFLNTNHFSQEFIDKYNAWYTNRETNRDKYIELSKSYNEQFEVVNEIYYRVPTDGADITQYESFSDEELLNELSGYEAQLKGYEALYVDINGNFDEEALKNSSDWSTYILIKDSIIPNLNTEITNRGLSKDDRVDLDDSYKYDFDKYGDAYGLAELQIQADTIKQNMDLLVEKGYDTITEDSTEFAQKQHELYLKYQKGYESCCRALEKRQQEYDTANDLLEEYQESRLQLIEDVSKESAGFTEEELALLDKYYIHTDYVNENIVTTSINTVKEKLDISKELLDDAYEELYASAHPKYVWSTSQDDLFNMPEFRDWHEDLDIGNFIRISIDDEKQVKLRVSSIVNNPFVVDSDVDISFTNVVQYKSKRNDFVSLLGQASSAGKNQITGDLTTNDSDKTTFNVDANFVRKLLNNGVFSGYMGGIVSDSISATNGNINSLVAQNVQAMEINVDKIVGTEAQFDELFSKYIDADYINSKVIISDVGEFKDLKADIAKLGNATIGGATIFDLTTDSATMNEAVIKDFIAQNITVGDLTAGDITVSDKLRIKNENESFIIDGSVLQFLGKDENGDSYVGVQLGFDTSGNPSLILKNNAGATVMTAEGITKDAIADELINNNMLSDDSVSTAKIQDGSVSEAKLGFEIIKPNEYGGLDISKIYDGAEAFGAQYTSFKESVNEMTGALEESITSVKSVVDSNTASIENTIKKTDTVTVLDESGNEVSKEIISAISSNSQSIDGFKNTVKETYVTKDDMSVLESSIEQNADNISLLVKSGSAESGVVLTDAAITAISNNINLKGKVTFESFDSNTQDYITTIEGDRIVTGSISAEKLKVTDLSAFNATIGAFKIGYTETSNGKEGSLKSGKTKLYDSTPGVYVGTDGVSIGDGTKYGWTQESPFRVNADGTFWVGNSDGHISVIPPKSGSDAVFEIATKNLIIDGTNIGTAISESIKEVVRQYGESSSLTEQPTEWNAAVPVRTESNYIWQKTYTEYMDGHKSDAEIVCITGPKGSTGSSSHTYIRYSQYANGNPMTPEPNENTVYMGICTTESSTAPETYSSYKWTKIKGNDGKDGEQGAQGIQGIQGERGESGVSGKTSYFHIKYAPNSNPSSEEISEEVNTYIGTYVDFIEEDSNDPNKYTWARLEGIQGKDGEQGIAGQNGEDGRTSYLHIKYSNDGGVSFTDNNGETVGTYIGTYTDFTQNDSTNINDYTWAKIQGEKGEQGIQGIAGKTSYFHIKYSAVSNPTTDSQMTENPSMYIGTYVDFTEADSDNPSDYTWSRFEGAQGEKGDQGIPGQNGTDGKTSYLHIAYASSDDGSIGFSTSNSSDKTHIGTYVDFTVNDSTNYKDYMWTRIKGEQGVQGEKGEDGIQYYTWLKYADSTTPSQMYDTPDGHSYMGLAYNKLSSVESDNYRDYSWSLIKGKDGVNGTNGKDGQQYYTWVKYADSPTTGMSDEPNGKKYIGLAYNKTTATESTNYGDYSWSLIKGADGTNGQDSILLRIETSQGSIFKGAITTTLTAKVYKGAKELTSSEISALGTVKWYVKGSSTVVATGLTYTVSNAKGTVSYTATLE